MKKLILNCLKWALVVNYLIGLTFLCTLLLNQSLAYLSKPSDIEVAAGVLLVGATLLVAFAGFGSVSLIIAKQYKKLFEKNV